jgi:hypothetical protein
VPKKASKSLAAAQHSWNVRSEELLDAGVSATLRGFKWILMILA